MSEEEKKEYSSVHKTCFASQGPLYVKEMEELNSLDLNNPIQHLERNSRFIDRFVNKHPLVLCPQFYVLHWAIGCTGNCAYCWLRGTSSRFFNKVKKQLHLNVKPRLVIFTNRSRMIAELRSWMLRTKKPQVLNAGELADSFANGLEGLSLMQYLIPFFEKENPHGHKLLLVTKNAPPLVYLPKGHLRNVIFSWSLSPWPEYEQGTALWLNRIVTAQRISWINKVRLRLDPLIPETGWKKKYEELVGSILAHPGMNIDRVTIGRLRLFPIVKHFMPEKHKNRLLDFASYRRPEDGRFVLPDEVFIEMARFVMNLFPDDTVFGLCKEPAYIWWHLGLNHEEQKCNCTV